MPSTFGNQYQVPASSMTTPAAPTAPASTSLFRQQGLGALITPITPSGKVMAVITATLTSANTTNGDGIILQMNYGAMVAGVAAPANAATALGSAVNAGATTEWATGVTLTTAANSFIPVCMTAIVTGLSAGQQYWFDVSAKSVGTASGVALTNVTVTLVEIG